MRFTDILRNSAIDDLGIRNDDPPAVLDRFPITSPLVVSGWRRATIIVVAAATLCVGSDQLFVPTMVRGVVDAMIASLCVGPRGKKKQTNYYQDGCYGDDFTHSTPSHYTLRFQSLDLEILVRRRLLRCARPHPSPAGQPKTLCPTDSGPSLTKRNIANR
jgi:hypothetical protein